MANLLKAAGEKSFMLGLSKCNETGMGLITKKNGILLDLGCGDGSLTMQFARSSGAKKVYGIEYVDSERKKAQKAGIKCVKADLNSVLPFKTNSFDVILSSQNIEHLHNTRLYLAECHRMLKPGGQLVVLTENLASWINILSLLFGWQPFSTANINGWSIGNPLSLPRGNEKSEEFINKYSRTLISGATGHVRVLAYNGLKEMLQRTGFKNVKMKTTGYLPFWGFLSAMLCAIDKRHGHFLIGTGYK
ncbi:MAG TPA: methyltransferase domain-containing protein [Candidatus Goldiibacteriota bacterium]|nr:methyltransferase domain-containing protein [Candidatus Goldiibacteriota bacterium]HRQ44168.1 methyltransferase domain-containing protein [Candidatus Goldiibacteriota bacterium]